MAAQEGTDVKAIEADLKQMLNLGGSHHKGTRQVVFTKEDLEQVTARKHVFTKEDLAHGTQVRPYKNSHDRKKKNE